ncbi:type IV toxin-antitoxin system AbiEi family antitoxin domain-containing protein [Myroides pelagicus]|uniref:Type IV toxin-antitoxin system AbiEi family antitoxin domain-containing protein n=1 Tax=Myroides pelagicus TaxID=270914 RepID=A0A7K1GRZ4_9FLAO|nr:DUF6088 family protein [Myroides pelagicus]MTH31099.1 hypothetical protein [Myroides pelagicus]
MKVTENIRNTIDRLPRGYIFTYKDFDVDVNKKEAIIKALNRMVDSGKIEKLSKGKYFKPEKTPFGTLQPSQEQIVKDLLNEDGKVIGYLTGYSIYNKLGLTTQVSNIIQIGKNQTRPKFKRERYTISFINQKNIITKKNIPLLQILDSIKYVKKIPDTTIKTSCLRFLEIIRELSLDDKKELTRLSLKYPPSTRALLGALLDEIQNKSITISLKESLNPITKYEFSGAKKVLTNASNWNII